MNTSLNFTAPLRECSSTLAVLASRPSRLPSKLPPPTAQGVKITIPVDSASKTASFGVGRAEEKFHLLSKFTPPTTEWAKAVTFLLTVYQRCYYQVFFHLPPPLFDDGWNHFEEKEF